MTAHRVTIEQFYRAHAAPVDDEKREAIEAPPEAALFLVAGPGTGKTACLALRVVKLLLVDQVPARGVIATTFTNKAADELRSRILGWGYRIQQGLLADRAVPRATKAVIDRIDINQLRTGTIDSLCNTILTDYRPPGTVPETPVDEWVAITVLLNEVVFANGLHHDDDLDEVLRELAHPGSYGWNVGRKVALLRTISERVRHDQIDLHTFARRGPKPVAGRKALVAALEAYEQRLRDRSQVDYAGAETEVLRRLQGGLLGDFTGELRAVLVDEYQDTNLLQESLYFELAKACGGALTVVGDDDQSLYRFRGASVELFRDYEQRYRARFRRKPTKIFLRTNYRSTKPIVDLVNNFATLDHAFRGERVAGKPVICVGLAEDEPAFPVLTLFRPTREELARDLADVLWRTFVKGGYRLPDGTVLSPDRNGGAIGDAALLCFSPRERKANGDQRLPGLLRDELASRRPAIAVFNPRGQPFSDVPFVAWLAGLVLECVDPDGSVEASNWWPPEARPVLGRWRSDARTAMASRGPLRRYVENWQRRTQRRTGGLRGVSALQLVYDLVAFRDDALDDPEQLVYLEVFTRQLTAVEQVSVYGGQLLHDPSGHVGHNGTTIHERSTRDVIRGLLVPIATDAIDLNDDLIEDFPRDRLSVLSIHQSKGLEFPLCIVDIGSDFKTNHAAQRRARYPDQGEEPHWLEDTLRPFSPLGPPARRGRDRAFDDLYRRYFVAFSRARGVLLLVGLKRAAPGGTIPNVAAGWTRDGRQAWAAGNGFVEL